ncbi:DUF3293 domain-containing protein [Hymenobacter sp. BT491]|uniref:DUF3293 domain-containing protein n=1 Tax=Hymenobacter sp. BT491 TaxID=2766779 RepID=UPI001653E298|nr:DUF3293 domain-containing protein [Hymenobacter sp. BT491]MBC6992235.1 DUF3293 domain-containing protein [Hymenobacter sp. BT491]
MPTPSFRTAGEAHIAAQFRAFQPTPHVTAAMVGISRWDWVAVPEGTSAAQALAVMRQHQFDVLPLTTPNGQHVTGYYHTARPGDFEAQPTHVAKLDKQHFLYYQTEVRDLLSLLAKQEREAAAAHAPFYFLTEGPGKVVGMVSEINLHSRECYQYLYAQLVALELQVSRLLQAALPNEETLYHLTQVLHQHAEASGFGRATKKNDLQKALEWYRADQNRGKQAPLTSYLGLGPLLALVRLTGLHSFLGFAADALDEFDQKAHTVVSIRNRVAHPVKGYPGKGMLIKDMWSTLETAEQLLYALQGVLQPEPGSSRPLVGQYFTSQFQCAAGSSFLRVEPGKIVPAHPLVQAHGRVAYLTAHNPDNVRLTDVANRERHAQLLAELEQRGIAWQPAYGRACPAVGDAEELARQAQAGFWREDGVWLLGTTRRLAQAIGKQFGQRAVVYAEAGGVAELLKGISPGSGPRAQVP